MSERVRYNPRRHVMDYTIGEVQAMTPEDRKAYYRALIHYWTEAGTLAKALDDYKDDIEDRVNEGTGAW